MDVYRKWFCTCTGKPIELGYIVAEEEERGEPACERCGATPSSDPKHTIIYEDEETDEV
jgi:hypothetical protein